MSTLCPVGLRRQQGEVDEDEDGEDEDGEDEDGEDEDGQDEDGVDEEGEDEDGVDEDEDDGEVRWVGRMVRMRIVSRCLKESESQAGGKNQEQLCLSPHREFWDQGHFCCFAHSSTHFPLVH